MTFSVATYNVYLGADLLKVLAATSTQHLQSLGAEVLDDVESTDFGRRARALVAHLGAAGWPDLVGFQEVCRWSTGHTRQEPVVRHDFLTVLVEAFGEAGAPYRLVASAPNFGGRLPTAPETYGELLAHNVTFARHDRVEVRGVRSGRFEAKLELPSAIPGLRFDVVRSWTIVTAELDGGVLEFANTHLETYDPRTRRDQLTELFGRLREGPAVVVGDFNEQPDALHLPEGWSDAWVACHGAGGGYTFQEADPLLRHPRRDLDQRIDYVLTRRVHADECRVIGAGGRLVSSLWPSDHAGVVMTASH